MSLTTRRVQVELEVIHGNLLETIVYLFLLFLVRGRSTFSPNHSTGGPIVGPNGFGARQPVMGVGVLHQLRRNGTLPHVEHTSRGVAFFWPSATVVLREKTIETSTQGRAIQC